MVRDLEPYPIGDNQKEKEAVEEDGPDVEEEVGQPHDAPAFYPPPPPDELFDISTTVDPSYIISLIRKLVPTNVGNDHGSREIEGKDHRVNGSSNDQDKSGTFLCGDQVPEHENMEVGQSACRGGDIVEETSGPDTRGPTGEETWEEYGCVLWDLAASRTHAELVVENFIGDVLLANLIVSQSVRVTEICLGIIGNLACHEVPMKQITSNKRLMEIIAEQLFLDDARCLCEAFRLLSLGLQSTECNAWAEAIGSDNFLSRILWITENTLNPQLLEKSIGLLLAILESQEVSGRLLPSLMKLGLPSLLINLLAFEMSRLTTERVPERFSVVDVILRAIETLSVLDGYSQEICSSEQLYEVLFDLVKLPNKVEVASSCVTAVVLASNILLDVPELATKMSQDIPFLQGLLEIFPFASSDSEARCASWSIMARLLVQVKENEISPQSLHRYVSLLASKSDLIEDDPLDQQEDNSNEESRSSTSLDVIGQAKNTALQKIISILNKWTASKDHNKADTVIGDSEDEIIARLLDCCHKHVGKA